MEIGRSHFWAVNAVNTEKSARAGRDWLTENDLDVPMLLDASGRAVQAYSVSALPTTVVLDAQGRLVARKTGSGQPQLVDANAERSPQTLRIDDEITDRRP
jgi:peroxiredoxin